MSASTEKKIRAAEREAGTSKKLLAAQEEANKKKQSRLRWTLGTIGVVILIAAILILNSGILYKTTALTIGDTSFSAAKMNAYYGSQYYTMVNNYGDYASIFGLDTSAGIAGLRSSQSAFSEGTWRDYFINSSKEAMLQTTALCDYAKENGIALTDEEKDAIRADYASSDMLQYVQSMGYANLDKFYAANYGNGVTESTLIEVDTDSALANKGLTAYSETLQYTDDELREHYASFNGEQDIYTYDYCLISAETDDDGNVTDEAKAEAKATADSVLKAYNESKTEDYKQRLTEAVEAAGADATVSSAMNTASGLGDMKDFLTGANKPGDAAVCETESGCYVAVFENHDDNNYNTVSVRSILIKAEADENGLYTDEAKAEAKAQAEAVLAEFKAGDQTEESFAALANQYSDDPGSNTNGGLYENFPRGQMVKEFNDWCFAPHNSGDTGIVYGESASYAGYHVMYYVSENDTYANFVAKNDLMSTAINDWLEARKASYTVTEGFGMRFVG